MGLQSISERKLRRASSETGLPLIRAMRHSNHLWFGWVREGDGHWHVAIDPSTWGWDYEPGCGFSSCSKGTHGPAVLPSAEIVEEHERRERLREEELERKDAEAAAFVEMFTEETQKWMDAKAEETQKWTDAKAEEIGAVARVHARKITEDLQAQGLLKPGEEAIWEWESEGEK